ncbi:MAG: ABC transporter ATP-binding protein [Dehalococcoidia bacterium]|nr:ABC transporter ATP-binding protein [Dehalococcoidia bacterium]
MLSVRGASKRYKTTVALQPVTFDLAPGEVLAVVGSNGAGKTTLIKSVVGLIRCEGNIEVGGIDVGRNGKAARRLLGYLPQDPAFHPDLTVQETAVFYAQLRRLDAATAREAVETVGLIEHAEKPVGALSGGMRQRLGLAVARLGDPTLLVLDEPTSGLDPAARRDFRALVRKESANGRAVLLSTHWLEDIPLMADRVLSLKDGYTQYLGSAAGYSAVSSSRLLLRLNGRSHEAHPVIRAALGADGVVQEGEWLAVDCAPEERGKVVAALSAAGIQILDLRLEQAALALQTDAGEVA